MTTEMAPDEERGELGAYIHKARLRCGLSQDELAEEALISNAYVSLIETGKRGQHRGVSVDILMRIADALGEPRATLLALSGYDATPHDGPSFFDVVNHDPLLRRKERLMLTALYDAIVGSA